MRSLHLLMVLACLLWVAVDAQCPLDFYVASSSPGVTDCASCSDVAVHTVSDGGVGPAVCVCDTVNGFQLVGHNADGSSICACLANNFKVAPESCIPCPVHSISPQGSTSCTCDTANGFVLNGLNSNGSPICYCQPNNYKISAESCVACPVHSISPAGSTACTCDTANGFALNGYNPNGSPICYCPANHYKQTTTSCVVCPPHSSSPASSSTCTCDTNYIGITINGVESCVD